MRRTAWLAGLFLLTHCIVEAPTGEPATTPPAAVAAAHDSQPLIVKSGANFENKVELLATASLPAQIAPGGQVRVTLYFKALETLAEDYLIFVHVEDSTGKAQRINFDHRPMAGQLPTTRWKKGELVRDDFMLVAPPEMGLGNLKVWVGLWERNTDARLKLANPTAVANDGNNRVLALSLPVHTSSSLH
jgi:hypothetical protein